MLKLLAFTLPLCLDTFAVAFGVLGEMHLTRAQRVRLIALLITFEAGMPLVGMALGAPLTHLVSSPTHLVFDPYQVGTPEEAYQLRHAYQAHLADRVDLTFVGRYIVPIVVPVVVGVLGLLMLDESFNDDDDDDEAEKARALVGARGFSIIGLGVAISIDELVMGFTIGFSSLPVPIVIVTIIIQGFLAIMLGQYLGRKTHTRGSGLSVERITTGSKRIAGGVLVSLAAILLVGPPVATHLLPHIIHRQVKISPTPPAVSTIQP